MKKQLLCFVMFLCALSLFAQPAIQFDATTIDFGNIKEEDGKVSGRFEFTNTGNKDLLLTGVKPGCGCTAADYTKMRFITNLLTRHIKRLKKFY